MGVKDEVLKVLLRGEKITPLEALRRFGCLRLGARILELRQEGYPVQTENVKRGGKRFAEYSLPGDEQLRLC